MGWPQPTQAWQGPLGWLCKGHRNGSAKTTGMDLQARICVSGPGSANPLRRRQSTRFFEFKLRYRCTLSLNHHSSGNYILFSLFSKLLAFLFWFWLGLLLTIARTPTTTFFQRVTVNLFGLGISKNYSLFNIH